MTESSLTIRSILKLTKEYFEQKGIESARLDAEVLLGHVLNMSRVQLYVNFDEPLQKDEVDKYRSIIRERAKRIPIAYIIGSKEFMSLDLSTGPGVLIPRPDTEVLVEAVVSRLRLRPQPIAVDVGTGTGAIAISIAKMCPDCCVYALDVSDKALDYARINIEKHQLSERVKTIKADMMSPVETWGIPGRADALISNPPYIPTDVIKGLQPEVSVHEPVQALDGGHDGLRFYRRLIEIAGSIIKGTGFLAFEVGDGQAALVKSFIEEAMPLATVHVVNDYAGIARVVIGELMDGEKSI